MLQSRKFCKNVTKGMLQRNVTKLRKEGMLQRNVTKQKGMLQSRKETKLKNKPWLSKGILISIQKKNLLYKRALKLNDSNTWAQYKVYRNKLTHIKEYAKRLYIKNLVNDNKHDTSSLWKIINKIIHLKNVKKNNIPNKMYASKSESAQGPQAISNFSINIS